MENYVRVRQPRPEREQTEENELRITSAGKAHTFIALASAILTEKGHSTIVIKAMGKAINKTVTIVEILKRRIPGLHQLTEISSADITDVWEPKEETEGLDRIETTRHASVLTITLSKEPLDTTHPGYQPPLDESEIIKLDEKSLTGQADVDGTETGRSGRGRRHRRR